MTQRRALLPGGHEIPRERLREWVIRGGRIRREDLRDDTPLIESRVVTSLQLMDLILVIEDLAGRRVDVAQLTPGLFKDIDTICRNFLER